jgi:glycosyltransferase involved in cell wall biosynthesis
VRDFLSTRPVVGRLLRWACRDVSLILANSDAVAADARAVLPNVAVQRLYNGIDVGDFSPGPGDGARLDALAGLPAGGPKTIRVGLPAAFARWKGQETFIRAAAQVAAERPELPVRFHVIGGPIYRTAGSQFAGEELRALASAAGLNGSMGFVPFQEEMAAIYRALDIVVQASTRPEPFGRTIVEAMACGRAVIVSQAGGAAELFTPEVDALGVPPGDVGALAAAIRRLSVDGELRERLGDRARLTAVERFDSRRLGPQVLKVYERLVGGSARAVVSGGRARRG